MSLFNSLDSKIKTRRTEQLYNRGGDINGMTYQQGKTMWQYISKAINT